MQLALGPQEDVADPSWVQSTATRHGIRVVYNVVYMGRVNSNKTWHTCSVQRCVHGYSQQQQDGMAYV